MRRRIESIRGNATFRRWLDILLLSAFGVVFYFAFQQPFNNLRCLIDHNTKSWSPLLLYCFIVAIIAGMILFLIRLGGLHRNHTLKLTLKYPPTYLAALIAALVVGCILPWDTRQIIDVGWVSIYPAFLMLICVCTGVPLGFLLDWVGSTNSALSTSDDRARRRSAGIQNLYNNDEEFLQWILEEAPIRHPDEDSFDHVIPARRIAKLLLQHKPSNVGIVGPYGSGKSSLLNLIEYYLLNDRPWLSDEQKNIPTTSKDQVVLCRIDGWGRTTGSVAQKILGLAIEEVRCHVDCMAILAVPESYQKAIAGVKSGGGAILAALLKISHDPVIQLRRLDDILSAAGLRLVIFLEDLDRNICDEIVRDEMPALLDRLRALTHVSFVLAIGTERQFADVLVRICDHVEAVA